MTLNNKGVSGMQYIPVICKDGSISLVRNKLELPTENALTTHEKIISELHSENNKLSQGYIELIKEIINIRATGIYSVEDLEIMYKEDIKIVEEVTGKAWKELRNAET